MAPAKVGIKHFDDWELVHHEPRCWQGIGDGVSDLATGCGAQPQAGPGRGDP